MKPLTIISAFITLLIVSYSAFSQIQIKGFTFNKNDKTAIPYVNIGIVNKNIGSVSDLNGAYNINITSDVYSDSIRFSSLGFKDKCFLVADFVKLQNDTILLNPVTYDIQEVEIISKELKTKRHGDRLRVGIAGSYGVDMLGHELGILLDFKNKQTIIKNFIFFIAQNNCDSLTFRINIYNLKDSVPFEKILKENLIVTTAIKKGFVNVNLDKYNLITTENIAITIEWIKNYDVDCVYFRVRPGFSTTPVISKYTSQGMWKKKSFGIEFNVITEQ